MREQIWLIRLVDSERSLRAVGRGHQLLRGILRRGYELRRPAFASPVAIHDLCHGLLVWFHYKHPLVLPWPTVVPGKQLGIRPDLARNRVEMVAVWAEAATCMHLCSSVLGLRVRNRRQMRMIEWSESSRFFVSCESPESSRWLTLLCEYLSCAYHTLCSICLEGLCLLRRSLCSYKKVQHTLTGVWTNGRKGRDYIVLNLGSASFKIGRLLFIALLCVHLFACAFYRVKKESALSQEDVDAFYEGKGVDPKVCEI